MTGSDATTRPRGKPEPYNKLPSHERMMLSVPEARDFLAAAGGTRQQREQIASRLAKEGLPALLNEPLRDSQRLLDDGEEGAKAMLEAREKQLLLEGETSAAPPAAISHDRELHPLHPRGIEARWKDRLVLPKTEKGIMDMASTSHMNHDVGWPNPMVRPDIHDVVAYQEHGAFEGIFETLPMRHVDYDYRRTGKWRLPDDESLQLPAVPAMAAYCIHVVEATVKGMRVQPPGKVLSKRQNGVFVTFKRMTPSARRQIQLQLSTPGTHTLLSSDAWGGGNTAAPMASPRRASESGGALRPPRVYFPKGQHVRKGEGFARTREATDGFNVGYELPELIGCVGSHSGTDNGAPLEDELRRLSLEAAFNDPRFPDNVEYRDLEKLYCSVSLLSPPEPTEHALDWDLGHHGVRLAVDDGAGRQYFGSFLPDTSIDEGWGKLKTIEQLLLKAGWPYDLDEGVARCVVERFETSEAHCTMDTYKDSRWSQMWSLEPIALTVTEDDDDLPELAHARRQNELDCSRGLYLRTEDVGSAWPHPVRARGAYETDKWWRTSGQDPRLQVGNQTGTFQGSHYTESLGEVRYASNP